MKLVGGSVWQFQLPATDMPNFICWGDVSGLIVAINYWCDVRPAVLSIAEI